MEDIKDDIGQMFQKAFEGHKAATDPGEWEMLAGSVQKINFFKFNAFQFNVYYASTILFCFFTCLGVGSHYTYSHIFSDHGKRNTVDLRDSTNNRILNNSSSIKDKSLLQATDSAQTNTKKNLVYIKSQEKPLKRDVRNIEDLSSQTSKNENVASNDTLQKLVQIEQALTSTDSTKLKKKRTLYITKQDTIIQFDTLKTARQKKRKLR